MGNRLSNILRLSATALLLVAGVYGYICYEKTRIVWWLPVAAAAGGAVVTMPLLSRLWSRLTGLDDPGMNRLCHLLGIGAVLYFLFMGGNCLLADPTSEYGEQITVTEKIRKVRHQRHRIGHRSVPGRTYEVFYLRIEFADGMRRKIQVPSSVYNSCRENHSKTVTMRRGFFGFPVIGRFSPPDKPQN